MARTACQKEIICNVMAKAREVLTDSTLLLDVLNNSELSAEQLTILEAEIGEIVDKMAKPADQIHELSGWLITQTNY